MRRRLFPYRWMGIGIIGIVGVIGVSIIIAKTSVPWVAKLRTAIDEKIRVIKILRDPTVALKTSEGRTNTLILGKGGADHEAPDLTDSMMVVSLSHDNKNVSMISIPRDIWIDSMKAKINSAYYYGEQKAVGGGVILARDAVYQVTNLPIHYTLLVDFQGFKDVVDLLGGVDIDVKRSFTDEKYPVEGQNERTSERTNDTNKDTNAQNPKITNSTNNEIGDIYETVSFEKGVQHMGGERALKFARSRNSTDLEEGTDFARAKRQQKILIAIAKKLRQKETITNLLILRELRELFGRYVLGDLGDEALLALGRIGVGINVSSIQHIGLDSTNDDDLPLLVNPPVKKYGQWVLEPRTGSWEEIRGYIEKQLEQ